MLKPLAIEVPSIHAMLLTNKIINVEITIATDDWQQSISVDASQPDDTFETLPMLLMQRQRLWHLLVLRINQVAQNILATNDDVRRLLAERFQRGLITDDVYHTRRRYQPPRRRHHDAAQPCTRSGSPAVGGPRE